MSWVCLQSVLPGAHSPGLLRAPDLLMCLSNNTLGCLMPMSGSGMVMWLPWCVQALRNADGMGGAPLAPTLLALLPSLLRLQVPRLLHARVRQSALSVLIC